MSTPREIRNARRLAAAQRCWDDMADPSLEEADDDDNFEVDGALTADDAAADRWYQQQDEQRSCHE